MTGLVVPKLSLADVTIGVITALPKELAPVRAVFKCDQPVASGRPDIGLSYHLGVVPNVFGGDNVVASCVLAGMGNNQAAAMASCMLSDCRNLRQIIMVGIAGAVPNPNQAETHVRLGDIVVSDQHGVVQFDFGKDDQITGFKYRGTATPPSAVLLSAVRSLQAEAEMQRFPWEAHITEATSLNTKWTRPAAPDQLIDAVDGDEQTQHPEDPERRPGWPRVFLGPIGSSNTLLKNASYRDRLRDQHSIRAVEMEAAGIADATWLGSCGYLVVRGTCDYCNSRKNDVWQRYAALVAAAYARAVVERTPSLATGEPEHTLILPSKLAPRAQATLDRTNQPAISQYNIVGNGNVVINQFAAPPPLPSPLTPEARQLAEEKGRDLMTQIKKELRVLETKRAIELSHVLEGWLSTHEQYLSSELAAKLYVTLADTAVVEARLNAMPDAPPDLRRARSYLERATRVQQRQ